jgi:Fumarylacetoacetate (FAA) hydrolase family
MAAAFITKGKKVTIPTFVFRIRSFSSSPQIVAIGRNYTEHIKELANTRPSEPFFFLKPTTSYVQSGGTVEIPRGIVAHHEGLPFRLFTPAMLMNTSGAWRRYRQTRQRYLSARCHVTHSRIRSADDFLTPSI